MMQIDSGIVAIFVTLLLSIVSLAAWLGSLSQRVKGNDDAVERIHIENRDDHQKIYAKLEQVNSFLRNGRTKA